MKHSAKPATTANLRAFASALRQEIGLQVERLEQQIADSAAETRRHFDVVAEDLEHKVLDSLGDVHSMVVDHQQRLKTLEQLGGVAS